MTLYQDDIRYVRDFTEYDPDRDYGMYGSAEDDSGVVFEYDGDAAYYAANPSSPQLPVGTFDRRKRYVDVLISVDRGATWRRLPSVMENSLSIESIIGQVPDTCDFSVWDKNRSIHIRSLSDIKIIHNIVLYDPRGNGAETVHSHTLFAGLVAYIVGTSEGVERIWEVSCQDYTILLDRTIALATYPAGFTWGPEDDTDLERVHYGYEAVLRHLFTRGCLYSGAVDGRTVSSGTEAGPSEIIVDLYSGFIEQPINTEELEGPSLDDAPRDERNRAYIGLSQLRFMYSTLREVMSQLAQYVGYDYYVDYDKKLHFYYRENQRAALALTDGAPIIGESVNYLDASWRRDATRLLNGFAVFGAQMFGDTLTTVLPVTAATQSVIKISYLSAGTDFIPYPEPGRDAIRVDINAHDDVTLRDNVHVGPNNSLTLVTANGNFIAEGVRVGDIVINMNKNQYGVVTDMTQTELTVATFSGAAFTGWDTGNTARIPRWIAQSVHSNPVPASEGGDPFVGRQVYHDIEQAELRFRTPVTIDPFAVRMRYVVAFTGGGGIRTSPDSVSAFRRIMSRRIVAHDINTVQGIWLKIRHLQDQYSFPLEVITCRVDEGAFQWRDEHGRVLTTTSRFHVGDWVKWESHRLRDSRSSVSIREASNYLIHRISTRVLGADKLEYTLEMRDWETEIL